MKLKLIATGLSLQEALDLLKVNYHKSLIEEIGIKYCNHTYYPWLLLQKKDKVFVYYNGFFSQTWLNRDFFQHTTSYLAEINPQDYLQGKVTAESLPRSAFNLVYGFFEGWEGYRIANKIISDKNDRRGVFYY